MSGQIEEATKRLYHGLWGILTEWFRVPSQPPTLPVRPGEEVKSFRPAENFLRYLKLQFWIALALVDLAIFVGWVVVTALSPIAGILLAPLALFVAVVPDIVAYLAIHLKYDTTWYVITDRSLRIRRGIWVITEVTLTFENVQNVSVRQGPIQRWFGVADVLVETAGGGSSEQGGTHSISMHRGLIEGVANAREIRELILARLRASRSAGLGDDDTPSASAPQARWSPEHVAALRGIRDEVKALLMQLDLRNAYRSGGAH